MKKRINEIAIIGISVILISISSWIEIPLIIPFTLQNLMVFLLIGVFGFKISLFSIIVYLIIGIIGVPVFSGFQGGLAGLLNYTGGFLVSFIFIPIIFKIFGNILKNEKTNYIVSTAFSLLLMYIIGAIWFYIVYINNNDSVSFIYSLTFSVIPFIIPDILKAVIAYYLIKKMKIIIKNEAIN